MFAKRARGLATFIALTMVFMLRAGAQAQDLARSDSAASSASATKKSDAKGDSKADAKVDSKTDAPKTEAKVDNAELLRIVTALEERVKELEARLAVAASAGTSTAVTPANAPRDATAGSSSAVQGGDVAELKKELESLKEEQKKNNGFLGFFRDVEVSGLVDGYYSYNFNRPDGGINNARAFDAYDNSFSLNLAKITLEKKNDLANPLGFKVDLGFGPAVDIVNGPGPYGGQQIKNLLQAYLSYVAPIGNGLTVDFGKFATPAGAEVIETKDNYNYSRGLLFTYGPYYHLGFRSKYTFNDKIAVTGFLLNGWDIHTDNNHGKTYGASVDSDADVEARNHADLPWRT